MTGSIQGILLMAVAGLIGAFTPSFGLVVGAIEAVGVMLLTAAGSVGLGVAIGSAINDFHAFQLISTFVMWPLFMLSGAFFPIDVAPIPLQAAMFFNPMFYGVELLRWCSLGAGTPLLGPFGWLIALGVLVGFTTAMVSIGTYHFSRVQV